MTEKKEMVYEGKAKKIFSTNDRRQLVQEFKDSLTAFNAQKKGSFQGKGEINHRITSCVFEYLAEKKIPTHYIRSLDATNMLVQKLSMIPLEVVVRNKFAGSISARLGVPEGTAMKQPLVEFFYKRDELNDPLVTEDHIVLMKLATKPEIANLKKQALLVNKHLAKMFSEIGIELIDFKIEFGKNEKGEIVLADEISPDSCRLWDATTHEKLDKDRFRRDLGNVQGSYELVCEKLLNRWEKK